MNLEHAALCESVDPADLGRRIKHARRAAGLTQAQLAGDDVSTAYISRVEDGQRRPALELLEKLAGRLGTPVEELLLGMTADEVRELQVLVDQAEFELASGEAQAALVTSEKVLAELSNAFVASLHRRALRVHAGALEALGDLDGAVVTLEALTITPTPDADWVRALISLSRCLRDKGDLQRAISVGEEAVPTIEAFGLAGLTEAIQLTITVAGAYEFRGESAHAMRLCKRAIAAADQHQLPIAKASAYWNASIIECNNGQPDVALDLAKLAMIEFEASDDARNVGRLRALIADLQLSIDPPDAAGALETLDVADREIAWSPAGAVDRARQHRYRGEAFFLLGDHEKAMEHLSIGAELTPSRSSSFAASIPVIMGRIAAAEGRVEDARRYYQNAIQTLSGIGADRDAAQLWFELGGLLGELGEVDGAHEAFRRAAVSTGLRPARTRPV